MKFEKSKVTPDKLKELREQLGYTNAQMADLLGITEQTWKNKLSGSSSGSIGKLEYEFLLLLADKHPKFTLNSK